MIARRRAVALAAAFAFASACTSVDGSTAPSQAERPPVSVDVSLGVLRVAQGDPLRIGLVLDTTDEDGLAAVLEAAFRTALEDFGPVQQGFRARIDAVIDSGCDRSVAARIGEELATDALLSAVLGPQCTASMLGIQGPLSDAGLVVIASRPVDATLTATPDGLPAQDRSAGMWRTSPSLLDEARAAAVFAFEELESRRAATLHDGSIESAALVTAFKERFELLGGTVVVATAIDPAARPDGDGIAQTLASVADARPDMAFLPLAPAQLLALAASWDDRAALRAVARVTSSRAATEDFLSDPASEGHLIVSPVLRFPTATSSVTGMTSPQVEERVASLSGVGTPLGWWAYAYDATTLLLRALEDASLIDVDGSLVVSRSELRETMSRLSFAGLTGDIACGDLGDCSSRRFEVHDHQHADRTSLSERAPRWSTALSSS
jgi:ABC-type branched-subunit amino acid transport system substrate-binding protein